MITSRRILLLLIVILLLLLFLAVPGVSWADSLEDAGRELAQKVAAALPAGQCAALEFQNASSLEPGQAAKLRQGIEKELEKLGHRMCGAFVSVRVRLAENLESFLIVAEFPGEGGQRVAIASFPRSAGRTVSEPSSSVTLEKELLLQQELPILDFSLSPKFGDATAALAVLEPEKLMIYARREQTWDLRLAEPLPSHRVWPRDLRGRVQSLSDSLSISLPGLSCQRGIGAESFWRCYNPESQENYRRIPNGIGAFGSPRVVLGTTEWGSERADLNSKCGSGRQTLATRKGDWTVPDAVQAFEIDDDQAVAVGSPVEFSGPVTALWAAGDESYVRAVVRNLKTGNYEAYRLTITCGR